VHSDILTFNPNSARPEEEIYVNIPKVKADSVLVPDSMALVFDFKNSNTKSWFRNNLGKLLQRRLEIRLAGEKVYDNSGESLLEVYKDLWLHRKQRDNMVEDGIASEAMRKKYPKTMLQTMMWMPLHCSKYLERNRESESVKS
jgi:thymidylate synthase ThyX